MMTGFCHDRPGGDRVFCQMLTNCYRSFMVLVFPGGKGKPVPGVSQDHVYRPVQRQALACSFQTNRWGRLRSLQSPT